MSIGDGKMVVECGGKHLEGFMHYAELADAIRRWLEEMGRRGGRRTGADRWGHRPPPTEARRA